MKSGCSRVSQQYVVNSSAQSPVQENVSGRDGRHGSAMSAVSTTGDGGIISMVMLIHEDPLGVLTSRSCYRKSRVLCVWCGSEACDLGYLCGQ